MSKPLTTKVSTPLSENVQIGPGVNILCARENVCVCVCVCVCVRERERERRVCVCVCESV